MGRIKKKGGILDYLVNDIYPAIQGEGVNTGIPMILIRLQGCGVQCPWCDTKETWEASPENRVPFPDFQKQAGAWSLASETELVEYAASHFHGPRWALVTGGEPSIQNLAPLAQAFKRAGYKTAIETSGTATGHLAADFDWVCVSPKFDMPGGKTIWPVCLETAHEIKHVVTGPRDIERLDIALGQTAPGKDAIISLQPASLNKQSTRLCVETVIQRGWRLSAQLHKLIDQR